MGNKNDKKENKKDNEKGKISDYFPLEINSFPYKDALENDKRTFYEFYKSLINEKHILFFTFNKKKDYNSNITKICFFIFFRFLYL